MKALIIANGTLPEPKLYKAYLKQIDLILCADGGANLAVSQSFNPDYIVGDLDSIKPEIRNKFHPSQLIYRPSQYATDLEKTLQFAIEKKISNAIIIGASGGRLDHQICNLNIIEKFSDRLELKILESTGIGHFVQKYYEFSGTIGQLVSLFAFRKTEDITTKGLKYPLQHASMEWAVNDGLSNIIVSNPVKIFVKKGSLFVFKVF